MRGQHGIYEPHGDWDDWAPHRLARVQPQSATVESSAARVLLVDRHGKPLLVKHPGVVGFRKP